MTFFFHQWNWQELHRVFYHSKYVSPIAVIIANHGHLDKTKGLRNIVQNETVQQLIKVLKMAQKVERKGFMYCQWIMFKKLHVLLSDQKKKDLRFNRFIFPILWHTSSVIAPNEHLLGKQTILLLSINKEWYF